MVERKRIETTKAKCPPVLKGRGGESAKKRSAPKSHSSKIPLPPPAKKKHMTPSHEDTSPYQRKPEDRNACGKKTRMGELRGKKQRRVHSHPTYEESGDYDSPSPPFVLTDSDSDPDSDGDIRYQRTPITHHRRLYEPYPSQKRSMHREPVFRHPYGAKYRRQK